MFATEAHIHSDFELEPERKRVVEEKVATWAFSAHDFTDDELLYAALVMLKHALASPGLSQWQMTEGIIAPLSVRFGANVYRRRTHCIPSGQPYSIQRVR